VLGGGLLAAAPATAATPTVVLHQIIRGSSTSEVCGIPVNQVIKGNLIFQTTVDASGTESYQVTTHAVQAFTNPANGKVVYQDNAGRDSFSAGSDGGVVNPDGSMTFTDTLTGRDMRIYTSHSSVLMKDDGYTAIVDTVAADGTFIDEQIINHGTHQFAGDMTAYCDAITAAIG
jgi:hypothetical protein